MLNGPTPAPPAFNSALELDRPSPPEPFAAGLAVVPEGTPPWPRWGAAAVWFYLLAMVLRAAVPSPADPDMFHEISLVRSALELGALPRSDIFAFTPTVEPSVHHEWGTGAVLYGVGVASGWGEGGVIALRYLLLAAVVWLSFRCARVTGATGALMAVCAPLSILFLTLGLSTLRAQMFTFAAVAALLLFLEMDARGERRWIALWLPIYLVWLNLHGGFVVGLGLFGAYAAEQVWNTARTGTGLARAVSSSRHLILTLAAMAVLPIANPYGWDYLPYLWQALLLDRPLVAEWAPLWDGRVSGLMRWAFVASLVPIAYAATKARTLLLPRLPLLALAAMGAASAQRMLPVYGIVWFCFVPGYLSASPFATLLRRTARRYRPLIAAGLVGIGAYAIHQVVDYRPWELSIPTTPGEGTIHYPAGAARYLEKRGFQGNLMTPFATGAYISWKLHPAVLVGIDSRYEVAYPAGAVEENHRLYSADPEWREILGRYPTDAVLVPVNSPLYTAMTEAETAGGDWLAMYRDDGFAIFARGPVAASLPYEDHMGQPIPASFP